MHRLILIGDSIRGGYQQYVDRELAGFATSDNPSANGGTSRNVLEHLDAWLTSKQPDLVHINAGLHDIAKDFDTGARRVEIDEYERNVRTILTRIKGETKAKVMWALTTPVNEQWHHKNKPFDRLEQDVRDYNAVALKVTKELGVPVNDLYKLVMDGGRDAQLMDDGVHFLEPAREVQGKAVAAAVRRLAASQ